MLKPLIAVASFVFCVASPQVTTATVMSVDRPCPFETFDFTEKFRTYLQNAEQGDYAAFSTINGQYGQSPRVFTAYEGDLSTQMAFAHFGGIPDSRKTRRELSKWNVISKDDGDGFYNGYRLVMASLSLICDDCEVMNRRKMHYILEFGAGCDLKTVQQLDVRLELADG